MPTLRQPPSGPFIEVAASPIVGIGASDPSALLPLGLPFSGVFAGLFSLGGNIIAGQSVIFDGVVWVENTTGAVLTCQGQIQGTGAFALVQDVPQSGVLEVPANDSAPFPVKFFQTSLVDGAWTLDFGLRAFAGGLQAVLPSFANAIVFG
jgi:hypothetical protein